MMTRPRRLGAKSQGVSWDEETKARIDGLFVKMFAVVREIEGRNLKQSEIIRLAVNIGLDVMERTALDAHGNWVREKGSPIIESLKKPKPPKELVKRAVLTIKEPLRKHRERDEKELQGLLEVSAK